MPEYTLTATPDEVLQASLDSLFGADGDLTVKEQLDDRIAAFENLAGLFIAQQTKYRFEDMQFDTVALRLMLGRFHRDAFGVHNLAAVLDTRVSENRIAADFATELLDRICGLGVRINTPRPMRTRVAAAFSLWMATFRPVCLTGGTALRDPGAARFCAALNFWIANQYLRKYGQVRVGTPEDAEKRYDRVHHDFTFRAVNLSSLEMLYCSVFQPKNATAAAIA